MEKTKINILGQWPYNPIPVGGLSDIEVLTIPANTPDDEIMQIMEAGIRWRIVQVASVVDALPVGESIRVLREQHTPSLRFASVDLKSAIEPFIRVWTAAGPQMAKTKEWEDAPLEAEIAIDRRGLEPDVRVGMYRPDRIAQQFRPNGAKFFLRFKNRTEP